METNKLIDRLRELSKIGIVNYKHDTPVLIEAADRIEELDERIAIMQESMEELEQREPVRHGHWEHDAYIGNLYKCTACGMGMYTSENYLLEHKYCFKCGAKMDEVTP